MKRSRRPDRPGSLHDLDFYNVVGCSLVLDPNRPGASFRHPASRLRKGLTFMRGLSPHAFHYLKLPALLLVTLSGCGPSQTDVTGKVTYNGNALDKPGGKIIFFGSDNVPVSAEINSDGTYRASGVKLGENRVAV